MKIKIMCADERFIPKKGHVDNPLGEDACFDLYAPYPFILDSFETKVIPTGVRMEIPAGYFGDIRTRSSILKRGCHTEGTIDSNYRGEIGVIVQNLKPGIQKFNAGERIAQIAILQLPNVEGFEVVHELSETDRGDCGFGSTGK